MGSLTALPGPVDPLTMADPGPPPARRHGRWLLLAAAIVGPVAVALLLTPWRERMAAADDALLLVVVIVAVATAGYRWAAAVCALASALAFDVLLTRPYGSIRITRSDDLVTALLLLVVGLAVGDLAARGRTHLAEAGEGRRHVALLTTLTEMGATGRDADDVVLVAARELSRLLDLRSCTFSRRSPGIAARVLPDGEVWIGGVRWSTGDLGLPFRGVDLPVRSAGAVVGHFTLMPVPAAPVSQEHLVVGVAVADQVGAALATRDQDRTG